MASSPAGPGAYPGSTSGVAGITKDSAGMRASGRQHQGVSGTRWHVEFGHGCCSKRQRMLMQHLDADGAIMLDDRTIYAGVSDTSMCMAGTD